MAHVIRIDDGVWDHINKKAIELNMSFESRNNVLRAALGLPPAEKHSQTARKGHKALRPSRGASGRPHTR